MKKFIISLIILLAAVCAACIVLGILRRAHAGATSGSGATIERQLQIGTIDDLTVSRVDVELTYGTGDGTATLSAPAEVMKHVKVERDGAELEVSIDDSYQNHMSRVGAVLRITAPVSKIDASLASTVVADSIVGSALDVEAGTAAVVRIGAVAVDKVDLEAATAAKIEIGTCTARTADIEAATAGSIGVLGGALGHADMQANTAGSVIVKATVESGTARSAQGGSIVSPL